MLNDGDLESALEHLPYVTQNLIPLCRGDCIKERRIKNKEFFRTEEERPCHLCNEII